MTRLAATETMLIDRMLPTFDATIVEHSIIEAPPETVYRAVRDMDFMRIHSPLMDAAMFVRSLPDKIAGKLGREISTKPPPSMRISGMLDAGDDSVGLPGWIALGENPPHELAFGAVGKVWKADIEWKPIPPETFVEFDEPGFAKIAANFSLRSYGTNRTLLSYEARTAGTDDGARRKFFRYWRVVRRFVGVVMKAAVRTARDIAEAA